MYSNITMFLNKQTFLEKKFYQKKIYKTKHRNKLF